MKYYMIINGQQTGPMEVRELFDKGLNEDTVVWREGMADWQQARNVPDLMAEIQNRRNQQNVYLQQPAYDPGYGYRPPCQPVNKRSEWLTWAIVATVLGMCSCLGFIFGIIGITKANTANRFWAMGNEPMGNNAESSAMTFTIIALCFDGLGIAGNIICFSSGIFSNL